MGIFISGLTPSLPCVQERRIPASQNKCETGNSLAFSVRECLDHNAQHRKKVCYRPGTFSGCRLFSRENVWVGAVKGLKNMPM